MVLLEEFKYKVRSDIRSHLDEQKVEELEKAPVMADDYATHKMSSKYGNPQQNRYYGSGNRENIFRNTDDRKKQGKTTENVGLVSKVEPLKPISCGKTWPYNYIKVRIVELPRISCKRKLNLQG